MKHTPATPLPWEHVAPAAKSRFFRVESAEAVVAARISNRENSVYIAHAANAYPRLVEALERCRAALRANGAPNCEAMKESSALLRELGEDA